MILSANKMLGLNDKSTFYCTNAYFLEKMSQKQNSHDKSSNSEQQSPYYYENAAGGSGDCEQPIAGDDASWMMDTDDVCGTSFV